ncbi:hypothetical protein C2S52_015015 [Perilla frutescens var. hirtella]|nr:hypothetical protein C2S52_015015 [Perilla frutescens var. hirtella]KAH6816164.1 hypothetical protein C2S51_020984 [Perilla frutescens var. frutescens]
MEGHVQVISKEMMKLESHSSHPLKNLKFSYIDRSLPSLYIPLFFFYEANESNGLTTSNHLQISQRLKQSLLDILPSFYPLTGRIKDKKSINCSGSGGVEFIEARVHAQLKHVVQEADIEEMKQYIPSECTTFDHGRQRPLLIVQITFFDCGGVVVGVCISHKIGDCGSALTFINAWASKCHGETRVSTFNFGTNSYFPAFSLIPFSFFTKFFESSSEFVTKRFVFQKEKLEILNKIATTSCDQSSVKDPTRVELVSSFIWKQFMAARLKKLQTRKIFAAVVAVNLRPRISPPRLFENVFGNCFMSPLAFADRDDSSGKFYHLIGRLRKSIRRVRDDYIMKPLSYKGSYVKDLVKLGILVMMGKLEWCYFTSWRGFSMYEVDYGWGKPFWFTTTSMPIKNLVVLVSSKSGDDVEAIVTMKQNELQMLEAQINLI